MAAEAQRVAPDQQMRAVLAEAVTRDPRSRRPKPSLGFILPLPRMGPRQKQLPPTMSMSQSRRLGPATSSLRPRHRRSKSSFHLHLSNLSSPFSLFPSRWTGHRNLYIPHVIRLFLLSRSLQDKNISRTSKHGQYYYYYSLFSLSSFNDKKAGQCLNLPSASAQLRVLSETKR